MVDIQLKKVVKRYGANTVIDNLSIDIADGEFVVFIGPSGCGKSTLLRMIAGLEEVTDGQIYIAQRLANNLAPAERGIAMVFQSYALYPHLTVAENIGFGLKMNGHAKSEVREKVSQTAKKLQIEPLLDRRPKQLSGGQRQRVAIGRAIIRDPKVFLFDEPLSNLDAELRADMRMQIATLHQELKRTTIYVTHDQVEAMTLADKVVVINQGKIEQVGTPMTIYHQPENLFVAGFMGSPKMNFIPAQVESVTEEQTRLRLNDSTLVSIRASGYRFQVGQRMTLGIRPEQVQVGSDGDITCPFVSQMVERLGNSTVWYGSCAGVAGFKVYLNGDQECVRQATEQISFSINHTHFFDTHGQRIERDDAD